MLLAEKILPVVSAKKSMEKLPPGKDCDRFDRFHNLFILSLRPGATLSLAIKKPVNNEVN